MGSPKFKKPKVRSDAFWDRVDRKAKDKEQTMKRKEALNEKRKNYE